MVHTPSRMLAPKGMRQMGKVVSWEREGNISVCCAVSAAGVYNPLMFIYPRARMADHLKPGGPVGAIDKGSPKGWMNKELFLILLQTLCKTNICLQNRPGTPVA